MVYFFVILFVFVLKIIVLLKNNFNKLRCKRSNKVFINCWVISKKNDGNMCGYMWFFILCYLLFLSIVVVIINFFFFIWRIFCVVYNIIVGIVKYVRIIIWNIIFKWNGFGIVLFLNIKIFFNIKKEIIIIGIMLNGLKKDVIIGKECLLYILRSKLIFFLIIICRIVIIMFVLIVYFVFFIISWKRLCFFLLLLN